jgi:hypothetical protein
VRTTLDIDDDVLRAAKELARRRKTTAGAVISELTRQALTEPPHGRRARKATRGFRPFAKRGRIVTNEQIDKIREEDAF